MPQSPPSRRERPDRGPAGNPGRTAGRAPEAEAATRTPLLRLAAFVVLAFAIAWFTLLAWPWTRTPLGPAVVAPPDPTTAVEDGGHEVR